MARDREAGGRGSRVALLGLVLGLVSPAQGAKALTITFDDTSEAAPEKFEDVVPGGEFGPELAFGPVSLDGAVIGTAVTPADQAATSGPQFYVTTDFMPLADDSLLPGFVEAILASPATSIVLDVGNGNSFAAEFTLTAFDGSDVVGVDSVTLAEFGDPGGFVGQLEVLAAEITSFTVISNQPGGSKLFSVDTMEITLIPEPATAALLLAGLVGLTLGSREGRSRPMARFGTR